MESVTVGGATYYLPYVNEVRPLTTAEYNDLRAGIQEQGITVPIAVGDGYRVIDGHNRLRIAAELGLVDVPTVTHPGLSEDEERQRAIDWNVQRRQLTPEEKAQLKGKRIERVAELRAEGMSTPAIARQVGVSQPQVLKDIKEAEGGRPITSYRSTPRQSTAERIISIAMEHPDWEQRQIAREAGVAQSTVNYHLAKHRQQPKPLPAPVKITRSDGTTQAATIRRGMGERIVQVHWEHPDWSNHEIARILHVHPGDVSNALKREREKAQSKEQQMQRVTPEQAAQLATVAQQRGWTEEMHQQARFNVGHPRVPQWHKDELLAGAGNPDVYDTAGRLVKSMGRSMPVAHPDYAAIALSLDQARNAMTAVETAEQSISGFPSGARADWVRYAEQVQSHLACVHRILSALGE